MKNDLEHIDVYPQGEPEHQTNGDGKCWCEPELNYEDPITGVRVYVHREIN